MTTYNWSTLTNGQTISDFDPSTDFICIDDPYIDASNFYVAITTLDYSRWTLIGPLDSTKSVSVNPSDPRALTTTNFVFQNGSQLIVGDGLLSTANDELGNYLVGTQFGDQLRGLTGDDSMQGLGGDDRLYGDFGNDTMVGGVGNDFYYVMDSGDVVIEASNEGVDTVRVFLQDGYLLPSNVENLEVSTGLSQASGNELDNLISPYATSAGVTFLGLSGNDTLISYSHDDTLIGGEGSDTYVVDSIADYIAEDESGGADTVKTAVINYTLPENVETLIFTGIGNASGYGNSLNNILSGNNGNDSLGGAGGADILAGGPGNDTYIVDDSGDLVMELGNSGIDGVRSSVNYDLMQAWHVENLVLTGSDPVNGSGNWLNNILEGNSAANVLFGNGGDDLLAGLGGNDTMIGGDGDDVFAWDGIDGRVDGGSGTDLISFLVSGGINLNLASYSGTVFRDIEVIDLTFPGSDTITLTLQDVLSMSSTTDTLRFNGNPGDTINTDSGWAPGGDQIINLNNYHTYTKGLATLLVDTDITVNVFS